MWREKSSGERIHPWLIFQVLNMMFLSVRKFVIHGQVEAGIVSEVSLVCRMTGMMVDAKLKPTNIYCINYISGESRC